MSRGSKSRASVKPRLSSFRAVAASSNSATWLRTLSRSSGSAITSGVSPTRLRRGATGTPALWRRAIARRERPPPAIGDGITRRQRNNLLGPAAQEGIGPDKKRADTLLAHRGERSVDLARDAGIENEQLQPEAARSLTPFAFHTRGFRESRIDQQRDDCSIGNELVQQAQSLPVTRLANQLTPVTLLPGRLRLAT